MKEAVRALAVHNRGGNIVTLVTGPADGPPIIVDADPDQVVSEVELTGSLIGMDHLETEERVVEVLAQVRIEEGKVVRIDAGA